MMQPMGHRPSIEWSDLRVVLAVKRSGSHGGAGRLLGVDPTTIGRRLTALEQALGVRLFDRTPVGLSPTREGLLLSSRAERVETEVLSAERELGGADARVEGPVRITATDGILHYLVLPALAALRRAEPGITLELRADTRVLDLSRREADVAIRLVRPKEPSLVARRWFSLRSQLYASRSYLERHGTPRTVDDLRRHDFVGFEDALDDLPQVRWMHRLVGTPRYVVRATTTTAQVWACREGAGLALLGTFVERHEPALVPVLPTTHPPARDAHLVVHQDLRKNARVAAVLSWLAERPASAATA